MSPRRIVIFAVISCLFSSPASSQRDGPPGLPPPVVELSTVEEKRITPISWVPGTVVSRNEARLAAEIEGRLLRVAEVGERFQTGETIAELDGERFRLQVQEVEAAIEEIAPRLEFYRKEVERLDRLASNNNAARSLLDETIAMRDELTRRLETTRARLRLARYDLDRTRIRTPFTGVVAERIRNPGEQVQVGDEIARLVDVDSLEVQAQVTAAGLGNLGEGDTLRVRTGGDEERLGRLRTAVPVGDRLSRLYEIRIPFEEADWPVGLPVRIAVPNGVTRSARTVPRDALVIRSYGVSVFRIGDGDMAEMVPVTLGYAEADWIEVQGEVQTGDRVVVRGGERLIPGQKVRQLDESPPSQ